MGTYTHTLIHIHTHTHTSTCQITATAAYTCAARQLTLSKQEPRSGSRLHIQCAGSCLSPHLTAGKTTHLVTCPGLRGSWVTGQGREHEWSGSGTHTLGLPGRGGAVPRACGRPALLEPVHGGWGWRPERPPRGEAVVVRNELHCRARARAPRSPLTCLQPSRQFCILPQSTATSL